jgi:hypothetical protein
VWSTNPTTIVPAPKAPTIGDTDADETEPDEQAIAQVLADPALPTERQRPDVVAARRVAVEHTGGREGDPDAEEVLEARSEHLIPTW